MALRPPDLDDRAFVDLLDEARARIITHDPEWTNHNLSDPGITLIELFAWLTDMLIYRTDQIPDRHVRVFLKLLNGPDWKSGDDLIEDVRRTVVGLRRRHRAVTGTDYELLAAEPSADIARTRCIPRRDLNLGTEPERMRPQAGHVSVIIVPRDAAQPDPALVTTVLDHLEPRRMLTTRLHVAGPVYAPVGAEVLLARRSGTRPEDVRQRAVEALDGFLAPLTGGADGNGWPFGRSIHLAEVFALLTNIPDVDHVPDVVLLSVRRPGAARQVAAEPLLSASGDPIGLGLAAHHLPLPLIEPTSIVVGTVFVAIEVIIALRPLPAGAERMGFVKAAVKRFLSPLHGGPDGASGRIVKPDAVGAVAEVALGSRPDRLTVELRCDPAHAVRLEDGSGPLTGVRVQPGELVDAEVALVAG
ncbi:baseplate J/gp47 family protein [Streptomyces sp. NRRL F-5755]|uniref:baseplate J/gp47 family protein n=1 Tax=Streptomyces sp. NRRL F-5755 TaxID=1519475 RepID=UPI0006AF2EFC|nr:baseplate J/gp47 family protein [Streptomyces sp. NRRL F-5755]